MDILGVRVDGVNLSQAVGRIVGVVGKKSKLPFFIVTPNPEQVVLAQDDKSFMEVLNRADLAIADGIGLVLLSKLKERVSGVELMERLIKKAGDKGWKVMLVGGRGETASRVADKYGFVRGFEGIKDIKNPGKQEERQLLKQINEYKPEFLFVGFGAPWQEKWVAKHLSKLKVKVVMVVGGAFDQMLRPSLRPPVLMEKIGLGWFYRLLRQPWRLKRQFKLFRFVKLVLVDK